MKRRRRKRRRHNGLRHFGMATTIYYGSRHIRSLRLFFLASACSFFPSFPRILRSTESRWEFRNAPDNTCLSFTLFNIYILKYTY